MCEHCGMTDESRGILKRTFFIQPDMVNIGVHGEKAGENSIGLQRLRELGPEKLKSVVRFYLSTAIKDAMIILGANSVLEKIVEDVICEAAEKVVKEELSYNIGMELLAMLTEPTVDPENDPAKDALTN